MDDTDRYINRARNGEIRIGEDEIDKDLIKKELAYIAKKKVGSHHIEELLQRLNENTEGGKTPYLFGLALSGGGIRSATFSLGVMQRLAGAGILKHVDYLSTVSGGGYIGTALSWWLSGRTGSEEPYDLAEHFPYGTRDPQAAGGPREPRKSASTVNSEPSSDPPILRHLRQNGRYLTPGAGITIWSGTAVVLRAVLLNLIVWIPTVALLLVLLRWSGTFAFLSGLHGLVEMAAPSALGQLATFINPDGSTTAAYLLPPVFLLSLLVALILTILFIISAINFSILSWMERGGAAGPPAAQLREISTWRHVGRWLLVGMLAAVDVAIFLFLFLRLQSLSAAMFAEGDASAAICGQLAAQWCWALALALALAVLIFYLVRRHKWEKRDWWGFVLIFAGFAALFVADAALAWYARSGGTIVVLWGVVNLAWVAGLIQLVALVGAVVLANFWIAYIIRWYLRIEGLSVRYGGRRVFEQFFGFATPIVIALLVLAAVPLVVAWIDIRLGGIEGLLSIAAGTASGFWGHLQSQKKSGHSAVTKLILIGGSMLFLFGIVLLGYRLAIEFDQGPPLVRGALAGVVLLAVLTGWFANINYISLHRFYRDRLMEAFMPDHDSVTTDITAPARLADDMRISDLWSDRATGPFHIINTNLVLVNSRVRKYRLRGGDNFILSPLYSGSAATGWELSAKLMNGEITLASAMATSGAAANPRSGPGGRGLTRNRFVSLLMTLLSFRLGHWVARPMPEGREIRFKRPNHFRPSGLYSILNVGYRETNALLELSDGGHFENLALYELIRRRCGLIIICDGGQDIKSSYADFVTAIQRVGDDFGATVQFDMHVTDPATGKSEASGPEALIARPNDRLYPKNAEYSDKGYFVATINYGAYGGGPWPEKGTILYLKTAMIAELSMTAKGYKGANPYFPNQTTADQFFDDEQFEAYREVGYRVAAQMIGNLALDELFGKGRPAYEVLRRNGRFQAN